MRDISYSYYLYLAYLLECGLFKLDSCDTLNLDFDFNDEHAGIIVLIRSDIRVKILLDYYEENSKLYIDVEIYRV